MAGAMLVMLAASRVARLRELMRPDTLSAGDHLKSLLPRWQQLSDGPSSPSVSQSVRIIDAADKFIKEILTQSPGSNGTPIWRRIEL